MGGALEIGGSSILLRLDGKNILFDSGIRQGVKQDPLPNFKEIQDAGGLDAMIISHAHLDHIGNLPLVSKEYPTARIYMNHMTRDLCGNGEYITKVELSSEQIQMLGGINKQGSSGRKCVIGNTMLADNPQ